MDPTPYASAPARPPRRGSAFKDRISLDQSGSEGFGLALGFQRTGSGLAWGWHGRTRARASLSRSSCGGSCSAATGRAGRRSRPRRSPIPPGAAAVPVAVWESASVWGVSFTFSKRPLKRLSNSTSRSMCRARANKRKETARLRETNLTLSIDEGELLMRVVLRSEGRQRPPRTAPSRERLSRWHRPRRGAIRPLLGSPG